MSNSPLLQKKLFLYVTEFFAGMAVMAVELGASRLLAPYFSSSQIVWTVIIGTIMIAMALGNVWGGRMADRNPDPGRLYGRLLVAAVWIAVIPFVGKYVIAVLSIILAVFVNHNFLVWASLVSCLVLFVFPLMLLGTVTPSLAKYTMIDLESNAAVVGRLGALNTIGSIIGTFVPTFVTIPAVGTAATFYIFAGVLALLALCYFISVKTHLKRSIAVAVLILAAVLTSGHYSFAFWEKDLTYEGESIYNYLQVKEDSRSVILSTNVLFGVQSILMKERDLTGMYYDYALAAPLMAGMGRDTKGEILILGLGSGTYASMCQKYYPNATVTGVEIDKDIVDLARQYFRLPEDTQVAVNDGRAYLAATEKLYDVIMVDAYQDITIPFQLSTVEMFTLVKEHLKENGVMAVNMNMRSEREGAINDYLCDTIAAVFANVNTVVVKGSTNVELFASDSDGIWEGFESLQTEESDFAKMMMDVRSESISVEKGELILTDDKAPVELLGMKVMDEMISEEIDYYKKLLKSGDIEKILQGLG